MVRDRKQNRVIEESPLGPIDGMPRATPRRPNSLAIARDRLHPAGILCAQPVRQPDDGAAGCVRRPNRQASFAGRTGRSVRSPPHFPQKGALILQRTRPPLLEPVRGIRPFGVYTKRPILCPAGTWRSYRRQLIPFVSGLRCAAT